MAADLIVNAVHAVTRQADALISRQEALISALTEEAERLAADFEQQKDRMASFSEAVGVMTFGLDAIAKRFPLLLGVTLAGVVLWLTRQQHQLGMIVDLSARRSQTTVYRDWYDAWALSPRFLLVQTVLWTLAGTAWVAVAGWQVWRWPAVDRPEGAVMAVLGCAVIVAAQVYRFARLRPLAPKDRAPATS